jgi:hypothetical protein
MITSLDALLASFSLGKSMRMDWSKTTGLAAYIANRAYDFSALAGTPIANTYPGTALTYVPCDEATGNGTEIFGMRHGGNVSIDIKSIVNMAALTAVATGVPGTFHLVDMCGYYPGINMNTAVAQTLTGTPSLRYTNGEGVRAFLTIRTTAGATAHNVNISYTNQAGTAGRTLPVTVSCTPSAIVPHITHSGSAANNYGHLLPLANGDFGMRSVQTLTLSAASLAGTAALVLCKPIISIPVTTLGVLSERDCVNQWPSYPVIKDGACLTWIYVAGAATAASTNFTGHTETVWG